MKKEDFLTIKIKESIAVVERVFSTQDRLKSFKTFTLTSKFGKGFPVLYDLFNFLSVIA